MISRRTFLGTVFSCCFAILAWFAPAAMPAVSFAYALGGKIPIVSQPASEFTLPTNTGDGEVSLSDFRGKWVVLYFYPQDFTAGCTLEARRFQQDLPKYVAKNTQIIGISADSVDSHAQFCDSENLKFPLLADTTGEVSKAYGSWLGHVSTRNSFLIDPNGILRETFVNVNPAIHSTEVLVQLEDLQAIAS